MAGFSFVLLSKSGPERVYTFIIKKKPVERNRKKITKTRHTKLEKAEMKKWAADAFSFDLCVLQLPFQGAKCFLYANKQCVLCPLEARRKVCDLKHSLCLCTNPALYGSVNVKIIVHCTDDYGSEYQKGMLAGKLQNEDECSRTSQYFGILCHTMYWNTSFSDTLNSMVVWVMDCSIDVFEE